MRSDTMQKHQTIDSVRKMVRTWKENGSRVGLVPTMGFLHEGHESLMRAARKESDKVVVSIFVNPLQFGPSEDLDRYPRDLERDLAICERNKVDAVFCPDVSTMYPGDFYTSVGMKGLTGGLCGKSRPGHFTGVCTVVCKLFNIVGPDFAYFGQKDAQQLAIVRQMVTDLNIPVSIVGCPIVREPDGLAKSSRNTYLSPDERKAALALSRALRFAEQAVERGERDGKHLMDGMKSILEKEPLVRPEYIEIVDSENLRPLEILGGNVLFALAAKVGSTRLIDNTLLSLAPSHKK